MFWLQRIIAGTLQKEFYINITLMNSYNSQSFRLRSRTRGHLWTLVHGEKENEQFPILYCKADSISKCDITTMTKTIYWNMIKKKRNPQSVRLQLAPSKRTRIQFWSKENEQFKGIVQKKITKNSLSRLDTCEKTLMPCSFFWFLASNIDHIFYI